LFSRLLFQAKGENIKEVKFDKFNGIEIIFKDDSVVKFHGEFVIDFTDMKFIELKRYEENNK
jgi:hypothetical protein